MDGERLWNKIHPFVQYAVVSDYIGGVARHIEAFNAGCDLFEALCQLTAIH